MVNNEKAGMDLKLIKGTPWGEAKGALVKDSLIVGHVVSLGGDEATDLGMVCRKFPLKRSIFKRCM